MMKVKEECDRNHYEKIKNHIMPYMYYAMRPVYTNLTLIVFIHFVLFILSKEFNHTSPEIERKTHPYHPKRLYFQKR